MNIVLPMALNVETREYAAIREDHAIYTATLRRPSGASQVHIEITLTGHGTSGSPRVIWWADRRGWKAAEEAARRLIEMDAAGALLFRAGAVR